MKIDIELSDRDKLALSIGRAALAKQESESTRQNLINAENKKLEKEMNDFIRARDIDINAGWNSCTKSIARDLLGIEEEYDPVYRLYKKETRLSVSFHKGKDKFKALCSYYFENTGRSGTELLTANTEKGIVDQIMNFINHENNPHVRAVFHKGKAIPFKINFQLGLDDGTQEEKN